MAKSTKGFGKAVPRPKGVKKPAAGHSPALPGPEKVGDVVDRAVTIPTPEERRREATARLKRLGLKQEVLDRVPAEAVEALAEALCSAKEEDREFYEAAAKLARLAPMTQRAQGEFEKADQARKTAKNRLDECLAEEHEGVMKLLAIREGSYQQTLPLQAEAAGKPAGDEAKPGKASRKAQGGPGGVIPPHSPHDTVMEAARGIVERARAKGKGLGATALARALYGEAKADLKGSAQAVLEIFVEQGLLVKAESNKKEATYWPAEKPKGKE